MRGRGVAERPETRALLLARVVFGESDLVVTLLSWADGKVSALAKGARKSQKRFGGALEPFQTLSVALEERRGDLWSLQRAEVQRPRVRLLGRLEAVTAAGEALRWTRHLLPARQPDNDVFARLEACLDALDHGADGAEAALRITLARYGFELLAASGYGLSLDACVRCGRPCPPGRAATVDVRRGGVVCQACGGGPRLLPGAERAAAAAWMSGQEAPLPALQPAALVAVVEEAMAAHADLGQ